MGGARTAARIAAPNSTQRRPRRARRLSSLIPYRGTLPRIDRSFWERSKDGPGPTARYRGTGTAGLATRPLRAVGGGAGPRAYAAWRTTWRAWFEIGRASCREGG